jgi:hypothetical protein
VGDSTKMAAPAAPVDLLDRSIQQGGASEQQNRG